MACSSTVWPGLKRLANVQHLHTPTPVRAALPACVRLLNVLAQPASYAGGGIGAGSEPEKEFVETELKFKALLESLVE
jgi:isochorismate synthase EntC